MSNLAFRVIGVRADGSEVILAENVDQARADEISHDAGCMLAFASIRVEQEPRATRPPPTQAETWDAPTDDAGDNQA